jgi:hypothetical protein
MATGVTACIDMEFGHVYGTCRTLLMPVEVGVVLYDPDSDTHRLSGRQFSYDIDLELWKNVTDEWGNTRGVAATVANFEQNEYQKPFCREYRLPVPRRLDAEEICRSAFSDLRCFMEDLFDRTDIATLTFFAENMEMKAFDRAEVAVDAFGRIDLQKEIRLELGMKDHLSLDKVANIIGFSTDGSGISSQHFRYRVPKRLRHLIKPHRALGDAARIFLLSRELSEEGRIFASQAQAYLAQYDLVRAGRTRAPSAEPAVT